MTKKGPERPPKAPNPQNGPEVPFLPVTTDFRGDFPDSGRKGEVQVLLERLERRVAERRERGK